MHCLATLTAKNQLSGFQSQNDLLPSNNRTQGKCSPFLLIMLAVKQFQTYPDCYDDKMIRNVWGKCKYLSRIEIFPRLLKCTRQELRRR